MNCSSSSAKRKLRIAEQPHACCRAESVVGTQVGRIERARDAARLIRPLRARFCNQTTSAREAWAAAYEAERNRTAQYGKRLSRAVCSAKRVYWALFHYTGLWERRTWNIPSRCRVRQAVNSVESPMLRSNSITRFSAPEGQLSPLFL